MTEPYRPPTKVWLDKLPKHIVEGARQTGYPVIMLKQEDYERLLETARRYEQAQAQLAALRQELTTANIQLAEAMKFVTRVLQKL